MNQSLINQFAKITPQVDSNGKIYSENPNNYDNRDDSDKPNDRLLKPGEIGIHVNEDKSKSELLMNVGTKDKPNIIRISNAIDTAQLSRITNHTLEQDFSIINKDGTTVFEVDEKDKTKGKLLRLTVICNDAVNSTDVLDIFNSSSTTEPWLSVSLTENSGHIFAVQGNLENLILKIKDNSGTYVDRTNVNISILLEYFMERQAVLSSIDTSGKPIKVIDSLDSNSATDVLSANMGKVLNNKITNLDNNKADLNKDNLFTSNNSFNNPVIVADPTADKHAVTKKYVDTNIKSIKESIPTDLTNYSKLDADNTFTGSNRFTKPVTVISPETRGQATNKGYVDDKISDTITDSLISSEKKLALSANMGRELNEIKMDKSLYAYGENSYADAGAQAGITLHKIISIDNDNKTITLDSVDGISVGDNINSCDTYFASIKYINTSLTVTEINNKTIAVTNIVGELKGTYVTPALHTYWPNSSLIVGNYSHAEGDSTTFGHWSHAEGRSTAVGIISHAEGWGTESNGMRSHTEGSFTVANGDDSHAEGLRTVASAENQHVQGVMNIEDTESKYAHIVGNGSVDTNTRSNAHTLDWNGNAWFAGNITVGGTSYDDANAKEMATKEYVNEVASSSSQPGGIIYDKKINSYAYPTVYVSENAYPIYTDPSTKFLCVIQDSENTYHYIWYKYGMDTANTKFNVKVFVGRNSEFYEDECICIATLELSNVSAGNYKCNMLMISNTAYIFIGSSFIKLYSFKMPDDITNLDNYTASLNEINIPFNSNEVNINTPNGWGILRFTSSPNNKYLIIFIGSFTLNNDFCYCLTYDIDNSKWSYRDLKSIFETDFGGINCSSLSPVQNAMLYDGQIRYIRDNKYNYKSILSIFMDKAYIDYAGYLVRDNDYMYILIRASEGITSDEKNKLEKMGFTNNNYSILYKLSYDGSGTNGISSTLSTDITALIESNEVVFSYKNTDNTFGILVDNVTLNSSISDINDYIAYIGTDKLLDIVSLDNRISIISSLINNEYGKIVPYQIAYFYNGDTYSITTSGSIGDVKMFKDNGKYYISVKNYKSYEDDIFKLPE